MEEGRKENTKRKKQTVVMKVMKYRYTEGCLEGRT